MVGQCAYWWRSARGDRAAVAHGGDPTATAPGAARPAGWPRRGWPGRSGRPGVARPGWRYSVLREPWVCHRERGRVTRSFERRWADDREPSGPARTHLPLRLTEVLR